MVWTENAPKKRQDFLEVTTPKIEADIMLNMRSFANFLKLRDSEHAQKEVRDLARQMAFIVKSIKGRPFKYTLKAFGY